jgi:hypothetical protein
VNIEMSRQSELVDLELIVLRDSESDQAILVLHDDEKIWLPRSAIEIEYTDRRRSIATITMSERLAIEKGLV